MWQQSYELKTLLPQRVQALIYKLARFIFRLSLTPGTGLPTGLPTHLQKLDQNQLLIQLVHAPLYMHTLPFHILLGMET